MLRAGYKTPTHLGRVVRHEQRRSMAIELTFALYLEQTGGLLPVLRLCIVFTIGKSPRACSKYSH